MMSPYGMPGRMPMPMSFMQGPYPGYMPGQMPMPMPGVMPGQMGPMGPMGGIPMGGMPMGMTPQMLQQMPPQFMQPPMMPPQQPLQQQSSTEKEELGEQLYPKIEDLLNEEDRGEAAKITGMILETTREEIIELINDPEKLKIRVGEALQLLTKGTGN